MAFLAKTYHDYGMARDTDVAVGKDTLAYENFNIRITARDRETLLSVTNDRGNVRVIPERRLVLWNDPKGKDRTQGFAIVSAAEYNRKLDDEGDTETERENTELHLMGTVIGYNVLNSYVTLFTTEGEGMDHIYRIEYVPGGDADDSSEWRGLELLSGDMGFDAHKPIETLGDYENDDVLKVYWLDGVNQPRVLNISDRNITENGIGDWTKIDFVAEFSPTLKVTVEKVYEGTAVFSAGIVQYVFTYGNKYGQQSNIVYVSPVYYASPSGRGGSPEESVNCQFRITVSGFDMTWQWLNVYRVMQTSESGQWTADRVAQVSVGDGEAVYTDDGSSAESVDPAEMLYVGGREISAYTMCAKDQTLFLGNLRMLTTESDTDIINAFAYYRDADGYSDLRRDSALETKRTDEDGNEVYGLLSFEYADGAHCIPYTENSGYYPYSFQLDFSGDVIRTFKAGEKYRIGMRFVTKAGTRTGVYWVGDVEQTLYPNIDLSNSRIDKACLKCALGDRLQEALEGKGYVQAELMMAERTVSDRCVQAQGIVAPTVFNLVSRVDDAPYAMASWYMRPRMGTENGTRIVNRHFEGIPKNDSLDAEIQCINSDAEPYDMEEQDQYTHIIWNLKARRYPLSVYIRVKITLYHARTDDGSNYELGDKFDSTELKGSEFNTTDLSKRIVSWLKGRGITGVKRDPIHEFLRHFKSGSVGGVLYPTYDAYYQVNIWVYYAMHRLFLSQGGGTTENLYASIDPIAKFDIYGKYLIKYCGYVIGPYGADVGRNYALLHRNNFFVDENVCTFNTPELADGSYGTFENAALKMRLVGVAQIGSNITDYTIDVGNYADSTCEVSGMNLSNEYHCCSADGLLTFPLYRGRVFNEVNYPDDWEYTKDVEYSCADVESSAMWIYPWHKTGSMTYRAQGDTADSGGLAESAVRGEDCDVMKSKTESNMRFSLVTDYVWAEDPWTPSNGIYPVKVFSSDEETVKQIETMYGTSTYKGNYDILLSCQMTNTYETDSGSSNYGITFESYDGGYKVYDTGSLDLNVSYDRLLSSADGVFGEDIACLYKKDTFGYFYDPVDITVKSTPHLVVAFRAGTDGSIVHLPDIIQDDADADADGSEDTSRFDCLEDPVAEEGVIPFLPWHYELTGYDADARTEYIALDPDGAGEGVPYFTDFEVEYRSEYWLLRKGMTHEEWESLLETNMGFGLEVVDGYSEPVIEGTYYVLMVRDGASGDTYDGYEITDVVGVSTDGDGEMGRISAPYGFECRRDVANVAPGSTVEITLTYGLPARASGAAFNLGGGDASASGTGGETVLTFRNVYSGMTVQVEASSEVAAEYVKEYVSETVHVGALYIGRLQTDDGTLSVEFELDDTPMTDEVNPTYRLLGNLVEESLNLVNGSRQYLYEIDGRTLTETIPTGFSYSHGDELHFKGGVLDDPYYFVAELYNDFSDDDSRYGGPTDYAVRNNTFIPLGNVTALEGAAELTAYAGDTYFQRWDCQKTRKWSDEAENNINEFVSVMLETYRNIEGRYDVRRGLLNNQATTPENSNLFNGAYDNLGTLFSGNVLDDKYSLDEYPAQLTWTLDKTPGSETDPWTNVTLASVLDMDGSKGPLEALRTYANAIFAFQDRGIAEVLFNTRTQLATTEGVPVEIANSGRVDGKRYVTERNGCRDKWSIGVTKGGLWFADGMNGTINRVSQQVEDVSTQKGMSVWARARCGTGIWDPVDYGAFAAFADTTRDEVYFCRPMEGDALDALCFSETLGEFTSFHGYGALTAMFNVADRLLAFRDFGDGESGMWLQGEGRYGEFFGEPQDWYVQFRVAPDPYGDKTFTNLEYRADVFDMDEPNPYMEGEGRMTGRTFDSLRVWDEYQGNEVALGFDALRDAYPDTRRLNRIWRTDIPRARRGEDNPFGLNRIRNPWVWLRLTGTTPEEGDYMMSFHDLTVKYIE